MLRTLTLAVSILFLSLGASAQRIKASARLDSANILIGDQVHLFLEIDHPKDVQVSFPNVPDTIVELIEVLERSGIDTFELDNEEFLKQIQSYTITGFDSGMYRIPPYWFKIEIDGIVDSVPSNGVSLHVHSLQIDTSRGPADIKMPYGAPLTLKEVTPYILGAILIAAIIFLLLYSIKRKKNNQPLFSLPAKPKEPAHIIALRELNRIRKEQIWQAGKTKQYYSELTEALRVYIEDRYDIPAMEQTSEETIASFRQSKGLITDKLFQRLSRVLQLADLVKFAKYTPLPEDDNLSLNEAFAFVNETKPAEVDVDSRNEKEADEGEDNQSQIQEKN